MSPPHTRTTAAATGGNSIPAPRRKGYTHLNVQFGRGSHAPTFAPHARHGLVCRSFRFTDAAGIAEEMAGAALIISHAGSGSIIESLSRQKPLLVVVNDALMDNHQAELAGQLDADGHLHCTGCEGLLAALQQRTPQCPMPPPTHPSIPQPHAEAHGHRPATPRAVLLACTHSYFVQPVSNSVGSKCHDTAWPELGAAETCVCDPCQMAALRNSARACRRFRCAAAHAAAQGSGVCARGRRVDGLVVVRRGALPRPVAANAAPWPPTGASETRHGWRGQRLGKEQRACSHPTPRTGQLISSALDS